MNNDLHHSHDKLFRETWSDLANARSFLQDYLPEKVLDIVRLDSLEICKDSFIEKDLKDYYSDMLYRVNFGESPGYIYFLFEHKSTPEWDIHLQVLEYMVKIWRLEQKQGNPGELSIIVPLVLYHGRQGWRINESFQSLFKGPVDKLPEYVPNFKYELYDLSEYSDEEIRGTVMARVTMLLLKHVFEPDVSDRLPGIFALLKELSRKKTGLQYFESLVKYIFSNVDDITVDKMKTIVDSALLEDRGEYIMTLAEKLRKEGEKRGEKKGYRQTIELGLAVRFPGDIDTVMDEVNKIDDLDTLVEITKTIHTASDISEILTLIK